MNSYTFPSQIVTDRLMVLDDPSDAVDRATEFIKNVWGLDVYIDAPNDDDVCEVTGPRDHSPEAIEGLIRVAISETN